MYIPNRHHPFWHLFLGFGSLVANGHVRLGIFDGSFQIYSFLRLQNCNSVEEFCANFINLLGFITSAVGNGREGGGEQGVTATLFLLYVLPPPLLPPTPAFRLPPPIEFKKKKKKKGSETWVFVKLCQNASISTILWRCTFSGKGRGESLNTLCNLIAIAVLMCLHLHLAGIPDILALCHLKMKPRSQT